MYVRMNICVQVKGILEQQAVRSAAELWPIVSKVGLWFKLFRGCGCHPRAFVDKQKCNTCWQRRQIVAATCLLLCICYVVLVLIEAHVCRAQASDFLKLR